MTVLWRGASKASVTGWNRTVFAAGWFWAGFLYQYKSAGHDWRDVCNVGVISCMRPLLFGSYHAYYDGPNCTFSIGWLRFSWSGNPWTGECDKCMPKEKNEHGQERRK